MTLVPNGFLFLTEINRVISPERGGDRNIGHPTVPRIPLGVYGHNSRDQTDACVFSLASSSASGRSMVGRGWGFPKRVRQRMKGSRELRVYASTCAGGGGGQRTREG